MAPPHGSEPRPEDERTPESAIGARVDPDATPQPDPQPPTQPGPTPRSGPRVASFWRRLGAYLLDGVVLFGANTVAAQLTLGPPPQDIDPFAPSSLEVLWPYYALNALVAWLYFAGTESSSWQATLGKRLLGMEVTDEAGERISFARATGRYFAKTLSALPLGLGFLMIFVTEKNQALHDKLASCLVVKKGAGEGIGGLTP